MLIISWVGMACLLYLGWAWHVNYILGGHDMLIISWVGIAGKSHSTSNQSMILDFRN